MAGQPLEFWTRLLHLPGFVVLHCEEQSQPARYCFTVSTEHRIGVCPHCHQASDDVHQTRTRERIVDLPISGYAVELKVRVGQFQCEHCSVAFTPAVPFLANGAHATERFLERAAELIRSSDVAHVAKFYGLPEQTLARWYYDYLERRRTTSHAPLKPIQRIGIDELSLKKTSAIRRRDHRSRQSSGAGRAGEPRKNHGDSLLEEGEGRGRVGGGDGSHHRHVGRL